MPPAAHPHTPLVQSRPVYITLPTDLVNTIVSATPLETPLDFITPENCVATEAVVLDEIAKQTSAAQERVVVIVDGCALRYGITSEVKDFLEKTKFPVFVTPMGKSAVDESYERFGGVRLAPERSRVFLTRFCTDVRRKAQFTGRQTNHRTSLVNHLHRCDLQRHKYWKLQPRLA